ncbi:hypothetical protein [Lacrimispora sp.]|uniref:hypothetical protein n=1 Tax=Lacrimispora sp. TaxID=2719234 RepID=UPI0032E3CB34
MTKKSINKLVTVFIIVFLIIGSFIIRNYAQPKQKSISVEMTLKNNDSDNIITSINNSSSIKLLFDFKILSDVTNDAQIYLLHNFKPVSFKLNSSIYKESYNIKIVQSKEPLISRNNELYIDNLDSRVNDFCLLICFNNSIFTKRFQVINKNLPKVEANHVYLEVQRGNNIERKTQYYLNVSKKPGDLIYLNDIVNNDTVKLSVSIENILKDLNLQRNENDEIIYAIVTLINDGEIIEKPTFFKSRDNIFDVNIPFQIKNNYESLRFLIFPYAETFNSEYFGTYKAFLWSDPIKTQKIKKGD